MFDKLKQWTHAKRPSLRQDQQVLTQWAQSHGLVPKPVAGQSKGLVIEWPAKGARLEWGPSQRDYIPGHELRWRAEGIPDADAQMVCTSRAMVRRLETDIFDQISDDQQKTVIDISMPDEVRWLAMLPKAPWANAHELNAHYAMMCCHEGLMAAMTGPSVCQALVSAQNDWWTDESLGVITHNRAWLTLRMSASELSVNKLQGSLTLFQALVSAVIAQQNAK